MTGRSYCMLYILKLYSRFCLEVLHSSKSSHPRVLTVDLSRQRLSQHLQDNQAPSWICWYQKMISYMWHIVNIKLNLGRILQEMFLLNLLLYYHRVETPDKQCLVESTFYRLIEHELTHIFSKSFWLLVSKHLKMHKATDL